jgi:hypothetical protein
MGEQPTIDLHAGDAARIERAIGWRPDRWRPVITGRSPGSVPAHWIVQGRGGAAFIKIGATAVTAPWLRREVANYEVLDLPFVPRVLGYFDDGARPVLALEDLSDGAWPPPWTTARIDRVLAIFEVMGRTPPPQHLARMRVDGAEEWSSVARDPRPFLAMGLCTAAWLREAIPTLIEAAGRIDLSGEALIHGDVRSDNICLFGERTYLIDWNHAQIGDPQGGHRLLAAEPACRGWTAARGDPARRRVPGRMGRWVLLCSCWRAAHPGRAPRPAAPVGAGADRAPVGGPNPRTAPTVGLALADPESKRPGRPGAS